MPALRRRRKACWTKPTRRKTRAKSSRVLSSLQPQPQTEATDFPASVTPQVALDSLGEKLTPFEHKEILQYKEIFCVGAKAEGKPTDTFTSPTSSYIGVPNDHVAYRYQLIRKLGRGASASVWFAVDHKEKRYVALKCFRNQDKYRTIAATELKIAEQIRTSTDSRTKFIAKMWEEFEFRGHLWVPMEFLGRNLYSFRKRITGLCPLETVRQIGREVLQGLSFLAERDIVHADIKPENILTTDLVPGTFDCRAKICDLGAGCFTPEQVNDYIQSRYYRAPEVIFLEKYTPAIDMWSLGCVLAELYIGIILFCGRMSETDQLHEIAQVSLLPKKMLNEFAQRQRAQSYFKKHFLESTSPIVGLHECPRILHLKNLPVNANCSPANAKVCSSCLKTKLHDCEDKYFVDFIGECLSVDPKLRITADRALELPFFKV